MVAAYLNPALGLESNLPDCSKIEENLFLFRDPTREIHTNNIANSSSVSVLRVLIALTLATASVFFYVV